MNFTFTEKEEQLRRELREFARTELPPGWIIGGYSEEYCTDYGWEVTRQISRKLAQRGWLAISWPREYGGLDATRIEDLIYREETSYHLVPGTDMGVGGISWIGHSLILFGSEEQKKRHLPGIAAGENYWCTGYSEPEAGSDLASLKCRAIKKGDEYVVNGQKVWISMAHRASWCWLAVRTDPDVPKHKGISLLMVDMATPGITVRPLVNPAGLPENCEIFFDDVRVPADCLVSEENGGWHVITTSLAFERTAGLEHLARTRRVLDEIMSCSRETKTTGKVVRHKLADLAIKCEVGRLMCYNIAWMEDKGLVPAQQASMAKNFCSELQHVVANAGMEVMGLYGQLLGGHRAPVSGMFPTADIFAIGDKLGAGTSDINRNLIAIRGLGLPRG